MQHFFHEIFNSLEIFVSTINWANAISFFGYALPFGASLLDYFTARLEAKKMYHPPIPVQSRRLPPRQQTRVRRRKHRSSI